MYKRKRESMKNFSKKGKVVATAVTATGVTFAGAIFTFITPTLADTVTVKTATELKTALDNKANQIVVGADIEGSFEIKKDSIILPLISEVIQLLQMDMHSLWNLEQKFLSIMVKL